jgi:hypothetical protein
MSTATRRASRTTDAAMRVALSARAILPVRSIATNESLLPSAACTAAMAM